MLNIFCFSFENRNKKVMKPTILSTLDYADILYAATTFET